ncbi:MAG: tRNA (adenosine(37)-N6)-threonylcarbamoyltransferase complex dimerization subunit type 1 TsaB [Armatimonadetes bacterium]|nr:tRNA (adenosine(37)-N6)-threonylcarbamoyltransferase complex dimerization subunit type 1 TsaB [Armatimonadota bacterium]
MWPRWVGASRMAEVVLGIESSGEWCSAAVVAPSGRAEAAERRPGEQLTFLFPMCQAVLREAGVAPRDLTRIAVTVGPGSFTGLRLGLTTARTMAQVLGCKLVPVSTLEAIALGMVDAHRAGLEGGGERSVCAAALTDARKGQVFAAAWCFHGDGCTREQIGQPLALDPPDARGWLAMVRDVAMRAQGSRGDDLSMLVGGSGLAAYPELAGEDFLVAPLEFATPHARHVAAYGAGLYGEVDAVGLETVDAVYLRPPDVKPPRLP